MVVLRSAGKGQHFCPAQAEFVVVGQDEHGRDQHNEQKLKVWSPLVPKPKAIRCAWACNPGKHG